MGTISVRVLSPYVMLKVKDVSGQTVLQGLYAGAVADAEDNDSLQKHLRTSMVEKYEAPADPEPAEPVDLVPPPDPDPDAPKGNASREEWAAYASTKGAPEEETRPVEDGGLKQTELREKYGN